MNKKILLFVYNKLNLGDSLFVYILSKKYPNVDFYIYSKEIDFNRMFEKYSNIKIIEEYLAVDNIDIDYFDEFIYIGGSIFMESEWSCGELKEFQKFMKRCKEKDKRFYYISCNFGPYSSDDYLNLARKNFELCDGICFRDVYSYNLFKDLNTVHYAPDAIFDLDVELTKKIKRSIGISVIDLSFRKELKDKQGEYEDYIKRIIKKFAKRKYKVYLFSFCEFENDEKAIERIIKGIPKEFLNNIEVVKYKDNIEEFLKVYSKMEYMVATRFHSMVLSILYNQKIYNLTYSQKQDNVIEDLKLFKKHQDIHNLTYETTMRKSNFKRISKNKVQKIKKQAYKQFGSLENIM